MDLGYIFTHPVIYFPKKSKGKVFTFSNIYAFFCQMALYEVKGVLAENGDIKTIIM